MKKAIDLMFTAVLLCCLITETRAEKLEIGSKFPVVRLSQEKKTADNTIVVFMPSLTYDCDYASMLTQSFYYYFDQRLAFEGLKKSPVTRIFLIVKDKQNEEKSTQNIIGGMNIIFDEKGELFSYFAVKQPTDKNAHSTVILLDSNDVIAHIDENYRAQGEHLKPLENKLKELNGIYEKVKVLPARKELRVGDKAPDFRVDEKNKLSDLRGNVVMISFYPAAFSGTLPKPGEISLVTFGSSLSRTEIMTCAIQLDSLDKKSKSIREPKRVVISSSTDSLLNKWREVLGTHNILYTNDPDYSIASNYFSYNPNGYNSRVSAIVDQKGKIAFIDKDFDFHDEAVLNAKIEELLNSNKH
jgi:peroxiredoxin